MLGLLFAAMYIAVNAAAIGYFLGAGGATSTSDQARRRAGPRDPRDGRRLPVGASAGVSIPLLGVNLPPLPEPYNFAPLVVGIWMLIGLVAFFVLRSRSPEAIGELGAAVAEG